MTVAFFLTFEGPENQAADRLKIIEQQNCDG